MNLDNFNFQFVLDRLQVEAMKLSRTYGPVDPEATNNFIDINKFIKVLYVLLEKNNLLLNSDAKDGFEAGISKEKAEHSNKFIFTQEYPDFKAENRNIITYEIARREPSSLSAGEDPFGGTKHYRPMLRDFGKNKTTGVIEAHLFAFYDNRIRFKSWSTKSQIAEKQAQLLENFLIKHYHFLRQFSPVILYEGRQKATEGNNLYGPLRYHEISLDYFVRTAEIIKLSENEIKNIEVNINEIKTILTDNT